jgi:hypothetical protein
VATPARRINLTLDDEHAHKLAMLAERSHAGRPDVGRPRRGQTARRADLSLARPIVTPRAERDVEEMIADLNLPGNTWARIGRSLCLLEDFPPAGRPLGGVTHSGGRT